MPASNGFLVNVVNGSLQRLSKLFHNPYGKANIGPVYLRYLKHISPGKLHYHKLSGNKTWFINGQEYLHGIKEIFVEGIYEQSLPDNAYILDCGANIGLSVIYLKSICPTATIVAFEPDKKNFSLLAKNIESHRLKNIELKNEAVWKEDTTLSFESDGSMGSKIIPDQKDGTTNSVQATRLKNYLDRKINFLKIDIEGAEFEVLQDIQDRLSIVENMFVEYHGAFDQNNELTTLFRIFTETGFHYYVKEAQPVYKSPFVRNKTPGVSYDVQLNIFCFRGS